MEKVSLPLKKRLFPGIIVGAALFGLSPSDDCENGLVAPAAACECAEKKGVWSIFPEADVRPTNGHVRLGARAPVDGQKPILVKAGAPLHEAVELERRVIGTADSRLLDLWPRNALQPNARYELRAAGAPPTSAPLLSFMTSGATDTKVPDWEGIIAAEVKVAKGGAENGSCDRDANVLEVRLAGAVDDQTSPANLIAGLWIQPQTDQPIPITTLPLALAALTEGGHRAVFGSTNRCAHEVRIPDPPFRVALRLYDLGGNVSKPSDIFVSAGTQTGGRGCGCRR